MKARKLTALVLAAGYFLAAHCRLACALKTPSHPPAAVEHRSGHDACGACPRHDGSSGQKNQPSPCRMIHLDGIVAAPQYRAAAPHLPQVVPLPPGLVYQAALLKPRQPGYGGNPDPPPPATITLSQSSRSPRAPPQPPAVL